MTRRAGRTSSVRTESEALRTLSQGLRHAAVRPSIHGYRPHDKQIAFHESVATIRGLFGGNRSGKTVSGAAEGVMRATGKHKYQRVKPPPTIGRVVAVDFLNGVDKIVKPEIARWLPPSELINGSWEDSFDKEHRTLELDNGSKIEFMSYEQPTDKFAGTSRDWFWMDEEGPRDIYIENLLRIADCGGFGWVTMTPLEGMTWVYDDIFEAAQTAAHIEVFVVDMLDNPHLNQGEMEVMLSGLTDEERSARAHGKFVQIGGLIYSALSERNILDEFTPPKDWLHVAGMDSGTRNPTAWLWACVSPQGDIVVYDEYYKAGQIVSYHAAQVHRINTEHDRIPDYYVGDPSIRNTDPITGTSILIEYINHGIPIILGNNDVKAGIDRVNNRLIGIGTPPNNRPFLYITKNCEMSLKEHRRYRWADWATRAARQDKNKKEEPVKKDDHTCDALRYLISSRPQVDEGTSVPENRIPNGSNTAVSPYDEPVAAMSVPNPGDSYLGSEY